MSGPILSAQSRRQPQQTRLKTEWRQLGIQEVFNGGVSTKGKLLYQNRFSTPIGLGLQIPINSNISVNTGVKVGAAWSIILSLRIDSFVDNFVYALRPSTAGYGLAYRNNNIAGRAAYYDGATLQDSSFSLLPDNSVSTIGLTFDGATYKWYKNGKQTNSTAGVSAGGGNWLFTGYVQTPTEGIATYPLIAFADRALSSTAMRLATANPWSLLIERRVPGVEFGVSGAAAPATWLAADVTSAGWMTTETSYHAAIDEAVLNDATYITSPPLTATPQIYSATFTTPRAVGTWTHPSIRAKAISGTGAIRLRYLDAGSASVGVSPWQALTNTLANYSITVTTTSTATQIQLEVTQ